MTSILLNGVGYRRPDRPVVVVCIDGGDPTYIEHGLRDGTIPNIARFMREGFSAWPTAPCPASPAPTTCR
jgi:phosphonoacetate hydrolase